MSAGVYVHCDAAGVARAAAPAETRNPTWVLITTILASGLAFLEGSVFNVGLPAIGETFNASASDLQWAINAYLLHRRRHGLEPQRRHARARSPSRSHRPRRMVCRFGSRLPPRGHRRQWRRRGRSPPPTLP